LGNPHIKVIQQTFGPIAPGTMKKLTIQVSCDQLDDEQGDKSNRIVIKDMLQVAAKNDIYKIPIEAELLAPREFDDEINQAAATNKPIKNSKVR
jgi:hypothetical protein